MKVDLVLIRMGDEETAETSGEPGVYDIGFLGISCRYFIIPIFDL